MSPTILRENGYRVFFFSREEERMHVHVAAAENEAKFWMVPSIELALNEGFSSKQISEILEIIRKNENNIKDKWNAYFGG